MSGEKRLVVGNGPGDKLELALGRNGNTLADIEWLSSGDNSKSLTFLRTGKVDLVLRPKPIEEVIDPMVRVDRNTTLLYADWFKEVMYPELEHTGPTEYDATKLKQFLSYGQRTGSVTGHQIRQLFESNNMIAASLGKYDLIAIKQKGVVFFRQNWKDKRIFGWRSIVRNDKDIPFVPYLAEINSELVLRWRWLGDYLFDNCPALLFY